MSFGAGTDWALGNGTSVGAYARLGRTLVARFVITFGSTSTFGTKSLAVGGIPFSLASFASTNPSLGNCKAFDVSLANGYIGQVTRRGDSEISIDVQDASTTYATTKSIVSTVPFTWATTDTLAGTFIAEATS